MLDMADTSDNSAQRPRARANNVSDNKGGDCCSIRRLALSQLLAGTVLVVVFVNFLLWAHNQQPGGSIDNPGSRTASNSGGGRLRSDKFSSSKTAGAHRRLGGGARVTLPLPPMILSPPSPPPPPPAYLLETGAVPFTAVPAFSGREAAFISEEGPSSGAYSVQRRQFRTLITSKRRDTIEASTELREAQHYRNEKSIHGNEDKKRSEKKNSANNIKFNFIYKKYKNYRLFLPSK
mmetsp:Transcript_35817/g.63946  ORF Transcript_35817/g.63946 Transcript_35817/m.63946 type:complete len:235 (-) Transcript_35817:1576-2280(-)